MRICLCMFWRRTVRVAHAARHLPKMDFSLLHGAEVRRCRIIRLCEKMDTMRGYSLFVAAAVWDARDARTWHRKLFSGHPPGAFLSENGAESKLEGWWPMTLNFHHISTLTVASNLLSREHVLRIKEDKITKPI